MIRNILLFEKDSGFRGLLRSRFMWSPLRFKYNPKVERLNNRPGKCLGFKSPNKVFFGHSLVVALGS